MPFARFDRMSSERLAQLVNRFRDIQVAVLGDFFLDKYLEVDPALAEVSIETGKTAHQVAAIRHSPGAAGTVVCNLAALGTGRIHGVGLTGDDGESFDLRQDLAAIGCRIDHLHVAADRLTPTYLKPRDSTNPGLTGEHQRYDTENRTPTSQSLEGLMIESLDALLPSVDAVIVLDQVEEADCGVVTESVREAIAERALQNRKVVFWADSRCHIREFRHVIIKPNQFELVGRDNPPPGQTVELNELAETIRRLRVRTTTPIFATRGPQGMVISDPELTIVPGVRREGPTDPTGAGDSATAGTVLALAAGASHAEAALVGNLVASITVEQLSTTGTAQPQQLPPRLELWQQQCAEEKP